MNRQKKMQDLKQYPGNIRHVSSAKLQQAWAEHQRWAAIELADAEEYMMSGATKRVDSKGHEYTEPDYDNAEAQDACMLHSIHEEWMDKIGREIQRRKKTYSRKEHPKKLTWWQEMGYSKKPSRGIGSY